MALPAEISRGDSSSLGSVARLRKPNSSRKSTGFTSLYKAVEAEDGAKVQDILRHSKFKVRAAALKACRHYTPEPAIFYSITNDLVPLEETLLACLYKSPALYKTIAREYGSIDLLYFAFKAYVKGHKLLLPILLEDPATNFQDYPSIYSKAWRRILGDIARKEPISLEYGFHTAVGDIRCLMDRAILEALEKRSRASDGKRNSTSEFFENLLIMESIVHYAIYALTNDNKVFSLKDLTLFFKAFDFSEIKEIVDPCNGYNLMNVSVIGKYIDNRFANPDERGELQSILKKGLADAILKKKVPGLERTLGIVDMDPTFYRILLATLALKRDKGDWALHVLTESLNKLSSDKLKQVLSQVDDYSLDIIPFIAEYLNHRCEAYPKERADLLHCLNEGIANRFLKGCERGNVEDVMYVLDRFWEFDAITIVQVIDGRDRSEKKGHEVLTKNLDKWCRAKFGRVLTSIMDLIF